MDCRGGVITAFFVLAGVEGVGSPGSSAALYEGENGERGVLAIQVAAESLHARAAARPFLCIADMRGINENIIIFQFLEFKIR